MNYVPLNRKQQISSSGFARNVSSPAPINNVQQKLAALTLRLEKEFSSAATVGEYCGKCGKCGQLVMDAAEACQALGLTYHNQCFQCIVCARTLRGKAFYRVHDQVYCEEDYLVRSAGSDPDATSGVVSSTTFSSQVFSNRWRNVSSAIISSWIKYSRSNEGGSVTESLFSSDDSSVGSRVSFRMFSLFDLSRSARWSSLHDR